VTITALPDDVLLKIFKIFIHEIEFRFPPSEDWPTLVHVCRRWRNLAFKFPRHLHLELPYEHYKRSVKEMLDIWPELPICIHDLGQWKADRANVVDALRLNHRVSRIRLEDTPDSVWETFAPLMEHPFPTLIQLWAQPSNAKHVTSSFLGGSTPSLRDLRLDGVSFPALPQLLLSSTNLIRLWHENIPDSGYISPEALFTCLPALTRLESLTLTFTAEVTLFSHLFYVRLSM